MTKTWQTPPSLLKKSPEQIIAYMIYNILGDPGAISRAGRKGATKVFKHRRKSPWVPTLTGPLGTLRYWTRRP